MMPLPADANEQSAGYRLVISECETSLSDHPIAGDPTASTSPRDFVRERVVYADTFEFQRVSDFPSPEGQVHEIARKRLKQ
jgi:hypothetical protein